MRRWDAILFDVDGTLYHARSMRARVALGLMRHLLQSPRDGARTLAVLRAYRHSLEMLRGQPLLAGTIRNAQIEEAARRTGVAVPDVRDIVERWFSSVPASALRWARRAHLVSCLTRARALGIRLGVVSDYEPERKLEALELVAYFDVVVHADDPTSGR